LSQISREHTLKINGAEEYKWAGKVARMGEKRNAYRILVEEL
jgi:hypothetical protein